MNTPPEPTPSNPTPTTATSSTPPPPVVAKRRWFPCGCWTWLFLAFVLGVLAALVLPTFGRVGVRGSQTKALAQAKQIGLALKLFAGDHNGKYPGQGTPVELTETPANANLAFATLFPTYTQSENLFGNKLSAYQSAHGPDNVIDDPYTGHPVQTLRPGENVYGYMMGLTEDSDPTSPLVVDGTDGTGRYHTREHHRGGTWKTPRAVVIHLDNSGMIETLPGPADALYLPRPGDPKRNALDPDYLGKNVRYLDPAFPPVDR